MGKGEATRDAILEHAVGLARRVGLEGLTIGRLADDLELSKSGLFAHFKSKEALQIQVLDAAAARFVAMVVRPALEVPHGEGRLRALFERWLTWERELPGGCVFMHAIVELDDHPGPARDALVASQRQWLATIARAVRLAINEGHFRPDLDAEQFAFQAYGLVLGFYHARRLLEDPRADARVRRAFDEMIAGARALGSAVSPATDSA